MFNRQVENDKLRQENDSLRKENAELKEQLNTVELNLYRRLFERININVEGGNLSGKQTV